MARNAEPVELSLVLFHTTGRPNGGAYLVGDTGERERAVWLPISQVEMDERPTGDEAELVSGLATTRRLPIHTFLVPEWLANERGLL